MGFFEIYNSRLAGIGPRGQCAAVTTGLISAGLAGEACIWTLRYPEAATKRLVVQRVHVHVVTETGFTTSVTGTRGLKLCRGAPATTAADPSGGLPFVPVRKLSSNDETLGIGRIATTGALTTTGLPLEATAIRRLLMAQSGASGADYDENWLFDGQEADPIWLLPGQMVAIAANATFDAAGTWRAAVTYDAVEMS